MCRRGLFRIIAIAKGVLPIPRRGQMRFKTMATITAVVFILTGLALSAERMNLFLSFGALGWLKHPTNSYELFLLVRLRSFVYLFGGALFGCGLLAWAMRNPKDAGGQTNSTLALFGLNVIVGVIALAQQLNFWRAK